MRAGTGRKGCRSGTNVGPGGTPRLLGPLVGNACANRILLLWAARSVAPRKNVDKKQTACTRLDTERRRGEPGSSKVTSSSGPRALATTRRRGWRAWIAGGRYSEGVRRRAQLVAEGTVAAPVSRRGRWPRSLAGTVLPPAPWRRTSLDHPRSSAHAFLRRTDER